MSDPHAQTLREALFANQKASWPRPIPAKLLILLGYKFDAEHATRDSKARPATLLSTVYLLYHQAVPKRKGMLIKLMTGPQSEHG